MNIRTKDEFCPHCNFFNNRGVSVDAVIIKDGRILLVQRGEEPCKGCWATPGGYARWDESAEDAIHNEVAEETGLAVKSLTLVKVCSSPDRHPRQVINIVYLVDVIDSEARPGTDAVAVRWFDLSDLPEKLAFDHRQNISDALKCLKA